MFLSGPSPTFATLALKLAGQVAKGIRDNENHYNKRQRGGALFTVLKNAAKIAQLNIIAPPLEFRDKPVPAPRTKIIELSIGAMFKVEKPVAKPRVKSKKLIPAPRTKITPVKLALKDAVETYEIGSKNKSDPLVQLQTPDRQLIIVSINLTW